jgi:hypothetical protein
LDATEVDGDALEYTGRGKELLFGFLIAMAVLGPIFLVYFLIGLEAERIKAFASLPLYLFMFAFSQFAAYRARRYRLTRTVWRGVRFWMTKSGWSYARRSVLWGLLLGPTFGLAYPWRMAALERYKPGHTLYGNLPGRFEATGWKLFKRVWWVWLLGLLPFVLIAGSLIGIAATDSYAGPSATAKMLHATMLFALPLFFALPFLHGIRRARKWAWWASGIRLGRVAIICELRSGSLIAVYWKLIAWSLLMLLIFCGDYWRDDGSGVRRHAWRYAASSNIGRAIANVGHCRLCDRLPVADHLPLGADAHLYVAAGLAASCGRLRGNRHRRRVGCRGRRRYRQRNRRGIGRRARFRPIGVMEPAVFFDGRSSRGTSWRWHSITGWRSPIPQRPMVRRWQCGPMTQCAGSIAPRAH